MSDTSQCRLALHGGAGVIRLDTMSAAERDERVAGLRRALARGWQVLRSGGSAQAAVVESVVILEDNPAFNAGRGSVLSSAGEVEMEAALMLETQEFAALSGLRRLRHPILGVQRQLQRGQCYRNGWLVEEELIELGEAYEEPAWFLTPQRQRQLERAQAAQVQELDHGGSFGTVGAVARDAGGRLAAATSTGGMCNKPPGRIGDSPLPGAGTWASASLALSATGSGEAFLRTAFAKSVEGFLVLSDKSLDEACRLGLQKVRELGGSGGCVAIDRQGNTSLPFISSGMYRAWIGEQNSYHIGIGLQIEESADAQRLMADESLS